MALVKAGSPRTLSEIESVITNVHKNKGSSLKIDRESLSKRHGALHDAARLQMLVTWARNSGGEYLQFDQNCSKQSALSSIAAYAPGMVTARLAKGVKVGSSEIPRSEILSSMSSRLSSMNEEDYDSLIRGRCVDFVCLSGDMFQYLRPLFSARSENSVNDKGGFEEFVERYIAAVSKTNSGLIPASLKDALGVFVNELFQNTQEHARSNFEGVPYISHAEGLIGSWEKIDDRIFSGDFTGNKDLIKYWEAGLVESGNVRKWTTRKFFQFSVFDSGPGLVGRFKGQRCEDLDRKQERKFLIESLKRHATSKSQQGAGQGIPNVLHELRAVGGLIRIRTGRQSIFNCFDKGDETSDIFNFRDWVDHDLDCVEGTVVSILIPLGS